EERTRLRLELARSRVSGRPGNGGSAVGAETNGEIDGQAAAQKDQGSGNERDAPVDAGTTHGDVLEPGNGPSARSITAAIVRPAPPHSELMEHAKKELLAIERFYDRAANKAARVMYFWGMVTGFVAALALAALMAFIVHETFVPIDLSGKPAQNFFVCFAAGALGAVISVLMRMRNPQA